MKLSLLLSILFLSLSSFAFQDGTYTCGSQANSLEISYQIKTLNINGTELPHLDITKNYYKNPADPSTKEVYKISGTPTLFTNKDGQETLILGNITVALKEGRISCN